MAYESRSEGFYRFMVYNGQYVKGDDYVTETFYHFDLQIFFKSVYEKLPNIPTLWEVYVRSKYFIDYYKYYESTKDRERMNDPVFLTLREICTNFSTEADLSCLANGLLLRMELEERIVKANHTKKISSNLFSSLIKRQVPPSSIQSGEPYKISKYEQRLIELFEKHVGPIQQNVNNTQENTQPTYNPYSGELPPKKTNIKSTISDTQHIVQIISEYIETYFDVDVGTQDFVTQLQIDLEQSDKRYENISFPLDIYRTKIINRTNGFEYFLYYGKYKVFDLDLQIIVNILPIDAVCHPTGLYNKYVSAGIYIYKIFDYFQQCYSYSNSRDCSTEYKFVGIHQEKMWPLPLLTKRKTNSKNEGSSSAGEGGRRKTKKARKINKTNKNNQHKKTRKQLK